MSTMPDMPDRLNRTLCILLFAVLLVVISRQIDRWLDTEIVWRMPLRAGCALLFGSMLLYHGKTYRPKQPAQGWERAVHAAKRILYYGAGCFALAHVIGVVSTYAVPGHPEQVRLLQRQIIRGPGQPRCEQGYCQWLVGRDNGSKATIWLPEHQQENAVAQIWVWQSWLAVRMESE